MERCLISILLCSMLLFSGCTKNEKRTKIQFSAWGSTTELAIIKPILKEFEKQYPDIEVEFLHIPQNYFQKLHLLFASNLAPDVVMVNNFYLPLYANTKLLDEIELSQADANDYFQKPIDAFTINNKLYALPRDVSNALIYYNKDLFRKYNISLPKVDWTEQEFLDTALALQKAFGKNNAKNSFAISSDYTPALFILPYLMSNNGGILNNEKQIIISSDNTIQSVQFFSDLINIHKVAPSKTDMSSKTSAQMFLDQTLAMQLSGRWLVPKYRSEANFDWDVITSPQGKAGSIVSIDSSGYAIAKSSKHKKEAHLLAEYLTSKASVRKFTESGLIMPARKSIANSAVFMTPNTRPQNATAFITATQTGAPTPVVKNYAAITDQLSKEFEKIFQNNIPAKSVLTQGLANKLQKLAEE